MKRSFLLLLNLFLILSGFTQTCIIRGKITDANNGEELIGAAVIIDGTYQGSSADLDGNYSITDLSPGTYNLKCSFISYETQTITGVDVKPDDITLLNIKMKSVSLGLDEVIITAKAVRNTESAILTMQKYSASVIDGISSQQITKSGDSDAAEAIKRVTGVSVEGGKYVYVRGLGDRYSKTTLNGCVIPSLDPERNTVQMDIFPTNAIENMIVYKSFSPHLNSFTGGLIDIITKDFPEKFNMHFSASFEYNTQSSLNKDFLSYEGGKFDWLRIDDGTRDFPINPESIPLYPTDRDGIDAITKSFNKNMEVKTKTSFLNQQYNFSLGNQVKFLGRPLGFNIGINYKKDYNYFNDGERGIYKLTDPNAKTLNTEQKYNETSGQIEVLTGGLINFNYRLSNNHKIGYVLLYNHSGLKSAYYNFGQKPSDEIGMYIENRELGFRERSITVNQLKGEHYFRSLGQLKLNWVTSFSISTQNEPDLRFFTSSYYPDAIGDAQYEINPSKYKAPSRFNRDMNEYNFDNKINFKLPFEFLGETSKFRFGAAYVYKNRGFREEKINYLSQVQYYNGSVEDYLDDSNIGQNNPLYDPVTRQNFGLYIQNATDKRNSYDGRQSILSGYLMVDMPLASKLRIEVGARFESNRMETKSKKKNIKKGSLHDNDVLPALNLTYTLVENMNLRFAYTQTLSRPTFREITPFASFSPVAPTIVGNPELSRTLINNVDLKWEYFMKPGEIVSFSLFYKHFIDPIEMVDNPIAVNPEISYQNVKNACNYGFEIELRKSMNFINILRNFNVGVNFSYIKSEVSIDPLELESIRALVPDYPDTRPLFGQAPYIINASLGYKSNTKGLSANLVFNISGARIVLVTKGGTPDIYEQPFPQLDFNIRKNIGKHFMLKLTAKNLLNSLHDKIYLYKDVIYPYYRYSSGRTFGLGIEYYIK